MYTHARSPLERDRATYTHPVGSRTPPLREHPSPPPGLQTAMAPHPAQPTKERSGEPHPRVRERNQGGGFRPNPTPKGWKGGSGTPLPPSTNFFVHLQISLDTSKNSPHPATLVPSPPLSPRRSTATWCCWASSCASRSPASSSAIRSAFCSPGGGGPPAHALSTFLWQLWSL